MCAVEMHGHVLCFVSVSCPQRDFVFCVLCFVCVCFVWEMCVFVCFDVPGFVSVCHVSCFVSVCHVFVHCYHLFLLKYCWENCTSLRDLQVWVI